MCVDLTYFMTQYAQVYIQFDSKRNIFAEIEN